VHGTVIGVEDVTVPAGIFAATAHVRLSITVTLHPTNPAYEPATATGWQESWYAPGVGVVRRSGGDQISSQTYDLVGWSNPGGAGGLVELTRLIVLPPSSDPWVTPWRVVPLRGGAQRALVLQLAWGGGRPLRLEGRFAGAGQATLPFEVVPEWPGDTLLPWRFVHQVAPGPDQHLVAFAVPGASSAMEVRAARVTAAGVARDAPSGIVVGQCEMSGTQAVAASRVGEGFLVAWSCDAPDQGVFAATVSADGAVGAPVKLGDGAVQFLQAAGDGSAHLVVWGRGPTLYTEVVAVRVSAGGAPLDAPVQVLARAPYKFPGDLACGASGCLLTWLEGAVAYGPQDLHAIRLVAGQPLEPDGVWLAGAAEAPLIAPSGDGFTLAWADVDAIRLARLGPALELSPAGGLPLLPHYDFYDPLGPGALLSATAADAWVAYEWTESSGELRAARWVW
jgi:hypothetical protein